MKQCEKPAPTTEYDGLTREDPYEDPRPRLGTTVHERPRATVRLAFSDVRHCQCDAPAGCPGLRCRECEGWL